MPNLTPLRGKNKASRRQAAFAAALAGLKKIYPLRGTSDELLRKRPGRGWQLRRRLHKACSSADHVGAGAWDVLSYLDDPAGWQRATEMLCAVDDRATPPDYTNSLVIDFAAILDRRRLIRESRTFFATTGPPRGPKNADGASCNRGAVGGRSRISSPAEGGEFKK